MIFRYRCQDHASAREGLLEAVSAGAARQALEGRGWRILELTPVDRRPTRPPPALPAAPASEHFRLHPRQLSLFTLQLHTMLSAGLPLVTALDALTRFGDTTFRRAMAHLVKRLEAGHTLSAALESCASPQYVGLVMIGEHTGRLVEILRELSHSLNAEERQRDKLRSSLTYPAFLLAGCCCLLGFLLWFLLPQLLAVLPNGPLPWPTRVVRSLAGAPAVPLLLALAVACALVVARQVNSPAGRSVHEWLVYGLPVVGPHLRSQLWVRLARSLGLMLNAGMLPSQALPLLRAGVDCTPVAEALREVNRTFREAGELGGAFAAQPAVPGLLVRLLRVGESTGQLQRFVNQYAELAELKLDYEREAFLAALEPLLIGVMGLVIGFVVMAAFLPVYGLVLAP